MGMLEDVAIGADWISGALRKSGYKADFSATSLWEIDRFFDEQTVHGESNPHGLLAEQLGQRLFALGSYIGEVVRRGMGGEWVGDDGNPEAEITITLRLSDGTECWPVQRVMKRLRNGAEDGVAAWGAGLGLQVGPKPAHAISGFWKRLFS